MIHLVMVYRHNEIAVLFNYCAELPDRRNYFVKQKIWDNMLRANKYSLIAPRILKISFIVLGLVVLASLFYRFFVLHENYPLPFEYRLMFCRSDHFIFYFINLTHQFYSMIYVAYISIYGASSACIILLHIIFHLKAINIWIANMEEGIKKGDFVRWLKVVSVEIHVLKL